MGLKGMKMDGYITVAIFAAAFVAVGFGWGRWYAEQQIRREGVQANTGRLTISMPADPKDASFMLGLLRDFMEQAEAEAEERALKEKE